ncbi:hypothetical protein C818_02577 [Lachnospiraceae bacterium MD308]|jgi:DNA-binding LytR/AlgR family response regulator|nr:hypothetical protein C818_02577 [Lachnospiraceae bacterium MD308]MCI8709553.1 LytTR family transcriptional regulator [Dorea sp.]MCI9248039.1 LytTR family transcriptional regulator [Dorea sp.]
MDYIDKLETDSLKTDFLAFLDTYGANGLRQAMDAYINAQQIYLCKTRTSTSKIPVKDIFYIEIRKHLVTIHAACGCFQKYGSLSNELRHLSKYGFVKCSQNYIVSLSKVQTATYHEVILTDHTKISLSKQYAAKVLLAFNSYD